MDSYPRELLTQLAPVMFVAGLDQTPATVPISSPSQLSSPSTPSFPSTSSKSKPQTPQDPFAVLTSCLRDVFLAQRKPAIYFPSKPKTFLNIPVDKSTRFPPRKMPPPTSPDGQPQQQFGVAHSPLSPLTPSSPLFPDGLIAPIWVRKHTTLVPSVFVLFLQLYEHTAISPRSPLEMVDAERERERTNEEKTRDTELAAEVARRKKSTNERGIKLTVVLMASRRMLDDPELDARLTFIRRLSGLDSRAALFVLSPVSISELHDFVRSLQEALYEPALEYYTNHSKRVRRKRNRHSQSVSSTYGASNPNAMRLRPEGWTVRYEYKMACFAEFRGEDEVALKHYQDAYSTLVLMFGSTAILPPRTKRWAEAKVLADCINVKICKLYLYNNEHSLALSHHSSHMRKFSDFSRGWGLGEETFEFWSWLAKQHRVLAELLEQGTRSNLTIPSHAPQPSAASSSAAAALAAKGTLEIDSLRALGINPSHALQHAGFYYYMAAKCTEKRRERFLILSGSDLEKDGASKSPGYENEKKVDHLAVILELYTKSHELFEKYSPSSSQNLNQGRLTLWIAYRIAETYYKSSKFDKAGRYFERIAKTYRREKWGSMLRSLLSTWHACAQQLGAVDVSIKILVEMLGHEPKEDEEPGKLVDELLTVLRGSTPPTPDEPLVVDLSESEPLFNSMVVFWSSEVKVGEEVAFQISVTAPSNIDLSALPMSSLAIQFTNDIPPVLVQHMASNSDVTTGIRRVDLGHISDDNEEVEHVTADLRWAPGSKIIFAGTMSSESPMTMKVSRLVLTLEENTWKVEIPFNPFSLRNGTILSAKWLTSLDPPKYFPIMRENYSSVTVRHRPHQLLVSLSHQSPALLDEEYPIVIDITNADDRELDVVVDVLLMPTDIDHAINHILFDGQQSTGLIKGVSFGNLLPGVNVSKTLYLVNTGAPGDRALDISIRSQIKSKSPPVSLPAATPSSPETSTDIFDKSEALQILTIPTVSPIKITYDVGYKRPLADRPDIANLKTFEDEFWDDGGEALISCRLETVGPWCLELLNIELDREDGEHAKVIECSLDSANKDGTLFPAEYLPGDEFSALCRVTLAPDEDHDYSSRSIPGPGQYLIKWRRISPGGKKHPECVSRFHLPPLHPPSDTLVALLSVPPSAKLHVPIMMKLKIRNLHPSFSANVTVQIDPDPSEAFVISGLRSGRVPILLPGGEEQLTWQLIPIECGYVKVPRIKVLDKRPRGLTELETDGEAIKVVDIRWDRQEGPQESRSVRGSLDSSHTSVAEAENAFPTILVLP